MGSIFFLFLTESSKCLILAGNTKINKIIIPIAEIDLDFSNIKPIANTISTMPTIILTVFGNKTHLGVIFKKNKGFLK